MHLARLGCYTVTTFGFQIQRTVHLFISRNRWEDRDLPYILTVSFGETQGDDPISVTDPMDILEHLSHALRRLEACRSSGTNHSLFESYKVAFDYFDETMAAVLHKARSQLPSHLDCLFLNDIRQVKAYMTYWEYQDFPKTKHALSVLLEDIAVKRLRIRKAMHIQRAWRCVVVDPCHVVCKRRLIREFIELSSDM